MYLENVHLPRVNTFLDEVEEKLNKLTAKIEKAADQATIETDIGLGELEAKFGDVVKWVSAKAAEARELPLKARQEAELGRVKLELAKMDTRDAITATKTKLDRIQNHISDLKEHLEADAQFALTRLAGTVGNIYRQLT
jgi:archaellum component FlaC